LREYLPLGQRVEAFAVDVWKDNHWREFARGTSIGNCKLLRGKPVTTTKVRLRITQAPVCPAISELALFAEPSRAEFVRLSANGAEYESQGQARSASPLVSDK